MPLSKITPVEKSTLIDAQDHSKAMNLVGMPEVISIDPLLVEEKVVPL